MLECRAKKTMEKKGDYDRETEEIGGIGEE